MRGNTYIEDETTRGRSEKEPTKSEKAARTKNTLRKISLSASPIPQIGILGVRHSTFESLRLGHSSQSIASNLLASRIP
ncbi:hypothetical protein YC2023_008624 [Brassica napus]